MKVSYEFEVPDDFEVGEFPDCDRCPLNKDNLHIVQDNYWYCGIVKPYSNCPLKVVDCNAKVEHENELYRSDV